MKKYLKRQRKKKGGGESVSEVEFNAFAIEANFSSHQWKSAHNASRRSPPACDKGMQPEILQFIICCS